MSFGGASGGAPDVTIHIEPFGARIPTAAEQDELAAAVQQFLNAQRPQYAGLVNCHEVRVRNVDNRMVVSCHCALDGDLSITRVHDITQALEDRVREKFPQVDRITIHPEPTEES